MSPRDGLRGTRRRGLLRQSAESRRRPVQSRRAVTARRDRVAPGRPGRSTHRRAGEARRRHAADHGRQAGGHGDALLPGRSGDSFDAACGCVAERGAFCLRDGHDVPAARDGELQHPWSPGCRGRLLRPLLRSIGRARGRSPRVPDTYRMNPPRRNDDPHPRPPRHAPRRQRTRGGDFEPGVAPRPRRHGGRGPRRLAPPQSTSTAATKRSTWWTAMRCTATSGPRATTRATTPCRPSARTGAPTTPSPWRSIRHRRAESRGEVPGSRLRSVSVSVSASASVVGRPECIRRLLPAPCSGRTVRSTGRGSRSPTAG